MACLMGLGLAGCAATPPEQDPVQIKLNDIDTRLARVERVMANQSLIDLANQGETLKTDLRAMHNDVDQLTNALEVSRKQQRDLYADLDRRMRSLESRGAGGASAGDAAAVAAPNSADSAASGADDRASYQAAFGALKDGQYDRAIAAFQKFLIAFADSPLADNAQYWLGEAYYVNKSFPEAQTAFQRVVDKYPQSRKIPDALLKIGYCRYELKQWDSAKQVLSQVATQYSDTPSGRLARQRLDKMATENH